MRPPVRATILGLALTTAHLAATKAVFCHYMVGTLTPGSGHAEQDIDLAQSMNFDAFALNVSSPTADWALNTTNQLFSYAASTGFKLFFSLDLSAQPDLTQFYGLLDQYLQHPAYFTATPNGKPMASTFAGGTFSPSTWADFRSLYPDIYFLPSLDDSPLYYNSPSTLLGPLSLSISGLFSWKTAWPYPSAPLTLNPDLLLQSTAATLHKSYIAPLSTLQYKHLPSSSSQHWYRPEESTLPLRITQILSMPVPPDFVEVLT
jgi:glucan endo-1,3-alpha-glucosidase